MKKPIHILVLRFSALGDVAMVQPVLRSFIQQYPHVKITVVSKPFVAPIFEELPGVHFFGADVVNTYKGLAGLFRLFRDLMALKPTHVADLHHVLRTRVLRFLFGWSHIPRAFIDKGRAEKKALTRIQNKVFVPLKTSAQRYVEVFDRLGFPMTLQQETIPQKDLLESCQALTQNTSKPWIGVAPFAAHAGKTYPLDLVEEVLAELSQKKYTVLLFGGGATEKKALESLANTYSGCISVAGTLTFREELNLIQHLDLMVSMDSGNAHLAAMQGIATLTIWGVTHPYAGFAPLFQPEEYCLLPDREQYPHIPCSIYGNKVYPGYEEVMRSISPQTVVNKIEEVLKKRVS